MVVQSLVEFNPGLSQNSGNHFFSKKGLQMIIKYCLDFPSNKFVKPKIKTNIRFYMIGNKNMDYKILTLVLIDFSANGP